MVVSTHLKNISQLGSFPQLGVKIKNLWNHHLDTQSSLPNVTIFDLPSLELTIFRCWVPSMIGFDDVFFRGLFQNAYFQEAKNAWVSGSVDHLNFGNNKKSPEWSVARPKVCEIRNLEALENQKLSNSRQILGHFLSFDFWGTFLSPQQRGTRKFDISEIQWLWSQIYAHISKQRVTTLVTTFSKIYHFGYGYIHFSFDKGCKYWNSIIHYFGVGFHHNTSMIAKGKNAAAFNQILEVHATWAVKYTWAVFKTLGRQSIVILLGEQWSM